MLIDRPARSPTVQSLFSAPTPLPSSENAPATQTPSGGLQTQTLDESLHSKRPIRRWAKRCVPEALEPRDSAVPGDVQQHLVIPTSKADGTNGSTSRLRSMPGLGLYQLSAGCKTVSSRNKAVTRDSQNATCMRQEYHRNTQARGPFRRCDAACIKMNGTECERRCISQIVP